MNNYIVWYWNDSIKEYNVALRTTNSIDAMNTEIKLKEKGLDTYVTFTFEKKIWRIEQWQ